MESQYEMRIVNRADGKTAVYWPPGAQLERDAIESIVQRVVAQPVGFLRGKAAVADAVRTACEGLLLELKARV